MSLQRNDIYSERLAQTAGEILPMIPVGRSDDTPALDNKGRIAADCSAAEREPPSPVLARGTTRRHPAFCATAAGCTSSQFDREEFIKRLAAGFRWHPHIGNVLTHICGSQWTKIEHALGGIVDPAATRADLSPLASNLVELLWAERGVTGRILKPYVREFVTRNLSQETADWFLCHLADLCRANEPGAASADSAPHSGVVASHQGK